MRSPRVELPGVEPLPPRRCISYTPHLPPSLEFVEARFPHPSKPAQNAYIERFNRTYREEVLDAYLFSSIEEVREITEQWLEEYNAVRPHAALGDVPPYQYAPNPA